MPNPRVVTAFRIDEELLDGMREVYDRDGVQISEQVRRAVRAWLVERGVMKAQQKTRKRTSR